MSRTRSDDACPGALHTHQAADGPLARIRLPGGRITPAQLDVLAELATRFADGTLHLTVRGSVQLRGITDTAAVARAVTDAGLLPAPSHERVRNVVASPLSGRVNGVADVRPWVDELDAGLCADPDLAGLPGRFWFALDDGRGDVSGLAGDVGVQVVDDGVALLLAGRDTGVRVPRREAVAALITVARRFTRIRGKAWRVGELVDTGALLEGWEPTVDRLAIPTETRPPIGWIAQDDGRVALGAAARLGVLTARQAQFVAAMDAAVVITPWRSLLICDLSETVADTALRVLPPLGLIFDDTSDWIRVSACVGSPGCDRSAADVRADAARAATNGGIDGPVHYAGCERACGRPRVGQLLIATPDGYRRAPDDPGLG